MQASTRGWSLCSLAAALAMAAAAAASCSVDDVHFQPSPAPEENCATPGDEDGNGQADCRDAACAELAACAPTCTDQRQNGTETDVDCGGTCAPCARGQACALDRDCAATGICASLRCRAAVSCAEILQRFPASRDGVYPIAPRADQPPFAAVCDMSRNGGGWTLLLKASGDATLAYAAAAWSDGTVLNETDLTTQPGNAKYPSFLSLPVQVLRGELDGFGFTLPFPGLTAREIFAGSPVLVTPYPTFNTGAANWSTQPNCQTFGINLPYATRPRFGWSANQEADCLSNDTAIGLGVNGRGAGYRCGSTECSAGNVDAGGNGLLWGK